MAYRAYRPAMFPRGADSLHWPGLLALILAVAVYWFALGSDHAATNGDELLYAQITRLTAETGHWLPLQAPVERHRNTKPPALFWQGIVSTDWAQHWDLWHLRYPCLLYTLGLAAMVFLIARRLSGHTAAGILAALAYLAFFGVYRYGRVYLTSAPEAFWLFLPVCILLLRPPDRPALTWPLAVAFGLMTGVALLYKSFALVLPAAALLAWWTLHVRGYFIREWLLRDAPKIALTCLLALGIFSLWFILDPQRQLIVNDFVVDENLGKFDGNRAAYFLRLVWGESSIWRNVISYPLNAGLLAPAIVALLVLGLRARRQATPAEVLLWMWVAVVFVVFTIPDQRDERYLLPGMPALAVLCALYWSRFPRWVLAISLAAVAVISAGMLAGAALLTRDLGPVYPWFVWAFLALLALGSATAVLVPRLTRPCVLPGVLLLYLGYALFLWPFDGPLGEYDEAARAFARGRTIAAPVNHGSREEMFFFMLPESRLQPYKLKPRFTLDYLAANNDAFIISLPLPDRSLENRADLRIIGTRLNLVDRFNQAETLDLLRGNVAPNLFKKDVLVEVVSRGTPGS
jgi:4-amino-4-deoxy-L-arabinose transferase-like glycosyltransferase